MRLTVTTMRRITYGAVAISFLVLVLLIVLHDTSTGGDIAEGAALASIFIGASSLYCWRGRS